MYEYVAKSEYAPIRRELEGIILRVQREMRKRYRITFQFQLIGSGKRHLVTRIKNGNRGYDFDYNLIISHPNEKAKLIKQKFMRTFETVLKGTQFSPPKDSTSVFTITVVDKDKIYYSCDYAIIYYENDGYYYLRNDKNRKEYEFVFRREGFDIKEKVNKICHCNNGWNRIRKEYLKLKNCNKRQNKRSFSLYIEAVNNVYNQMFR